MHKGINSTLDEGQTPVITHSLRGEGFDTSEDGTGRGTPLVPVAFSAKDHGADATANLSPTLRAMGHAESHANGGGQVAAFQDRFRGDDGRGYGRVPPVSVEQIGTLETVKPWNVVHPIAFQPGNLARGAGASPSTEVFPTLKSDHGRGASDQDPHVMHPIAFPANLSATQHASTEDLAPAMGAKNPTAVAFQSSQSGVRLGDTHATLDANNGPRRHNGALVDMAVRRLTPVECERLQGFPDNYTAIPWRKKPAGDCPDGPRYKALGNSWATPNVRWIGARIKDALQEAAQKRKS